MVWLPLGVRLIERATAAGGGLAPIAEEPEGVGATGAPEADAVVGITLFFPLGVDTTIGWDGDGCVEAMMTDIFLKCLGLYKLAQHRSSENVGINAEIEGVLLLNLPKS